MKSIRRQLTRELLAAITFLLVGGLVAIYLAARESAIEQFDDALSAKALAIGTLVTDTNEGVRLNFSDRFFRGFDDDRARDFFQLWDDDDRVVARSDSMERNQNLPRRTRRLERPARWNLTLPNDRPGRAVGFTFRPNRTGGRDRGDVGELQLVVASDRSELDELLWRLAGISAGCGVLLFGATLWLVPRVLRRGLKPLDDLGAQVQRVDADSLATRLAGGGLPAELQPVTQRLNELLERLEQSFERERRFSADLAHELRTPLAELRSQTECALKWPESRDPATDRETLAIAEHMEAIVAHILALTRGEQGTLAVRLETLAIDALVDEVWRPFAARAVGRRLAVNLSLAPTMGTADRALLRATLGNLLDNAVDHALEGGEVSIVVETVAGAAVVRVGNSAGDLQPEDVPKLFQRFWRKEAARSGGQHVGLGLCLARSFAEAMHWSLSAEIERPGWVVFTLRGPVPPE